MEGKLQSPPDEPPPPYSAVCSDPRTATVSYNPCPPWQNPPYEGQQPPHEGQYPPTSTGMTWQYPAPLPSDQYPGSPYPPPPGGQYPHPPIKDTPECQPMISPISGGQSNTVTTVVYQQEQPISMSVPMILACFVFWCCNFLFGLVAFFLAVFGQSKSESGKRQEALTIYKTSIAISTLGIIVSSIFIVICIVLASM